MTETVWIVIGGTRRAKPYHTEEHCQVLKRVTEEGYRPVPLNSLNGAWDECKHCADEVDQPDPVLSDEAGRPSQPTSRRGENVIIGAVWTADRGFVEVDVDSQPADRSFAEVRG